MPEELKLDAEFNRPPFEDQDTLFNFEDTTVSSQKNLVAGSVSSPIDDLKLQLGFQIQHLFLVGSPLGIFVSVYNEENFIT